MSYKTLLVHLDDSPHCTARTTVALDLARRYNAHLIGLYTVCREIFQPLCRPSDSVRLDMLETQYAERREQAQAAFIDAAQRAACSFEWRAPPGPAVAAAVLSARHADLIVLGQLDPHEPSNYIARHFIEDVLMTSGRPALILPYAGQVKTLGENVVIAWDASREAARALTDALPLIRRARFVTIETVGRQRDDGRLPPIDVAAFLERHQIQASFSTTPHIAAISAGTTLLNRVADLHADLLVMGAYGHSRAQERVLGGSTRTVLESMTVPVLMSH
ncbi:universal stress protein [Paraburkholderia sp. SOS3]|uniref:universal stress protein n=1 Tax=Paraburkholderia sp. SOS3 TaxID=1926494 RepID=UPI0009473513|nr:universal stress protein [Paraburkholderia sp. SOS3]APR39295.1 universal stress protein UspA [Paraburkholderia sp. SOS3]